MNRTKLPADRAVGTSTSKPSRRWQATAVALAAAALLSVPSFDAQALALGRVTVQSALGEPLRVDIDLPEITAEEVSSLKATIAPASTFQNAGMEYNTALSNVQVAVQRRPDGTYFLRLSGDRPINEPFVDVVLETSWSSGRIRRDFTMLFDPPAMRRAQQPLTAQTSPVPSSSAEASATPAQPRAAQQRPAAPASAAPATSTARAPSAPAATPASKGDGKPVTVQAGDTAGKIAASNKPATVSLDQMLVAMLRSNPEAFSGGNINRLRAGTVLNLPSQEQAEAVTPSDARETLVAQSRDFNEFRRKVAEAVPAAPSAGTERETRGTVQGQVDEKKPSANTPDRLTLSKGAVQGKAGEDKIARDRSAKDSATRLAELNRNLSELNGVTASANAPKATPSTATPAAPGGSKTATPGAGPSVALGTPAGTGAPAPATNAATAAAPAATPVKPAQAPAAATPAPTPAPAKPATAPTTAAAPNPTPAPTAAPAAPVAATSATPAPESTTAAPTTSTPAPGASAPTATNASGTPAPSTTGGTGAAAPAAARKPAPAPAPEPSLVDQIVEEPLIPGAIGAAVLALLGLLGWRARQRHRATSVDSSFLESRLQPDSFFGASGGQRVDTNEGTATGSSMVYSPSQLDAAGDVDPVAEADVYLAYGRDLQAEEILKEALRINPQRVAIHVKLLEIYAKRRDAKAFEQVASEAYSLTHGEGGEWARICELGQELDPANPMYKPGGHPGVAASAGAAALPPADPAYPNTTRQPATAAAAAASSAVDLDLDLDFSLGDEPADAAPAPVAKAAPSLATKPQDLAMDFSSQSTQPAQLDAPSLTLSDNSLDFSPSPLPAPAPAAASSSPARDPGMMEFDLGALSLDLDPAPTASAPAPARAAAAPAPTAAPAADAAFFDMSAADSDDPLATKLALAEEFNAIGDADGARSLAQEVIAEASGDLKSKAQKFLAEIG